MPDGLTVQAAQAKTTDESGEVSKMSEAAIIETSGRIGTERMVRFVPLGISKVSDVEACVGAISEDGSWVRPETPTLAEVKASDSPFVYFQWANAELGESLAGDARPEDHHMVRRAERENWIAEQERLEFIRTHLDPSAEDGFRGLRSLGLIKVDVQRFYMKRSTAGRRFLRVEFADAKGDCYDWIVSEVRFPEEIAPYLQEGEITPEFGKKLADFFHSAEVYFTIALTKPNNRFPGKFRGCHPVVIGIHTVPDYRVELRREEPARS
ncbi:MAG TPA: hypothetical protein VE604_10375 [Candidatus Polarisedimenticolia bacterium]|nr:hypothetical protein [Candidatus Polarisedimenticolia bacterium]